METQMSESDMYTFCTKRFFYQQKN